MKRFLCACSLLGLILPGCGKSSPVSPIAAPKDGLSSTASPIVLAPSDWPWWRGRDADGRSNAENAPIKWSRTENVRWSVPVAGAGHSSPIVCGNRIFLTSADEEAGTQSILAFERDTGQSLWSTVAHTGDLMHKHQKNSHASATPACDGHHVFAAFINSGALHVTAVDLQGDKVWQTNAGSFTSEHGYGSAPVLYESLVIVNGDSLDASFIAALDRATGDTVWRTPRTNTGRNGSYATPVVAEVAGRTQLLLSGSGTTTSYDPATGELIWSCKGPAAVTANTIVFSDDTVFATGGFPEKELLAIRADGSGDVTDSHVVWRTSRGTAYVPSPLYHDGRLYVIGDNGIATCFDATDGKQLWQKRLDGNFTSSPVMVGDLIYATNEGGMTFVLKAGSKAEVVAKNDLEERTLATPTIAGDRIYLRTESHLYCIAE